MKYDEEIDVRRLRLAPGDVIVLTVPLTVGLTETDAAFKAFKGKLAAAGHGDTPVILSTGEVSVSVLEHGVSLEQEIVQGSEGPVEVRRLGDSFAASVMGEAKASGPDLRTFADPVGLPADVVELVYAARAVAFADWNAKVTEQSPQLDMIKRLDRASEAFAELLPWEDDPNDENPDEPPARPAQRVAGELIAERMRQITGENRSRSHDDGYQPHELPAAAAAYAFSAATRERFFAADPVVLWPWDPAAFKQTDPRRDLVKAGALIIAEIERIDRLADAAELETVAG